MCVQVYPLKLLAAYALRDSKEIETLKGIQIKACSYTRLLSQQISWTTAIILMWSWLVFPGGKVLSCAGEHAIAGLVLLSPSSWLYRACDMTRIDIEKLYDDISQDFLLDSSIPMYSPQKKDDSVTR